MRINEQIFSKPLGRHEGTSGMGRTIKAQATCTVGICKFQTISGASFSSFAIPEKCFLWLYFSEKSKVRKPTPKYKFYGGRNLSGAGSAIVSMVLPQRTVLGSEVGREVAWGDLSPVPCSAALQKIPRSYF